MKAALELAAENFEDIMSSKMLITDTSTKRTLHSSLNGFAKLLKVGRASLKVDTRRTIAIEMSPLLHSLIAYTG